MPGHRVQYGAVFCGASPPNVAFAIPGLDFYALDWYDTWNPPLFEALYQWSANVSALQPSPMLAIAETNSNVEARRPLLVLGGVRLAQVLPAGARRLGRSATGATGTPAARCPGPGCPTDTATIAALDSIGADAQTT